MRVNRPIFLDDERHPPSRGLQRLPWVVLRSYDDAVSYVTDHGCPDYISFDHDLGEHNGVLLPTGYDFAKWLCAQDMEASGFIPSNFEFYVHSMNPIGKANIDAYMRAYIKQRPVDESFNPPVLAPHAVRL